MPIGKEYSELMEDKPKFLAMAHFFLEKAIEEGPKASGFIEYVQKIIDDSVDSIFEACESPIEKMLISSLLLHVTKNNPGGIMIFPKIAIQNVLKSYESNAPLVTEIYNCSLQTFIQGEKKSQKWRVDLLFWVPSRRACPLVVECDGYEFHRNKTRFNKDRRRDRDLKLLGLDVVRFSGTEIYKDPVKAAVDLEDYLDKHFWR